MNLARFWYRKVYLNSPAWKITRWLRKGSRCQSCGGRGVLHLHHVDYHGYLWWNLLFPDLISSMKTLCAACHRKVHSKRW